MKKTNRTTSKQIVALIGVVLLVLLYITTLVLAITDNSGSGKFFMLSLCCTLVVPMIVFIYSWMWARITGKKAVGDPDLPGTSAVSDASIILDNSVTSDISAGSDLSRKDLSKE
ncbi:MAG: hypothetical protein IJ794_08925 [Lachnospiraceae bacterium]|nr:hypothetical protein [Lachnospiraceae bacterium]